MQTVVAATAVLSGNAAHDGSVHRLGLLLHPRQDAGLGINNIYRCIVQARGEHLGQEQQVCFRKRSCQGVQMFQIAVHLTPVNVVL